MNSDNHKWYFYPKMNRDEVVCLKLMILMKIPLAYFT
ncbi:MAG: hypothetical protein Ct9H90mP7_1700 [Candidatus Neomarinimicrobiota bacterium]|nr:MAG: hypothetical protein Ct9H90mP7_1700 [Candidatus Neomarinimicrobiota bacterium]